MTISYRDDAEPELTPLRSAYVQLTAAGVNLAEGDIDDPGIIFGDARRVSGYSRYRVRSRVDELPPEARERIDEMLASQQPYYTYQDISDALADQGLAISKSSIGRYVARRNANAREVN